MARKFNGEKFFFSHVTMGKKAADKYASDIRNDGFKARVVKTSKKIKGKPVYHVYEGHMLKKKEKKFKNSRPV